MNTDESAHQPTEVTRRKHPALATERSFSRYGEHLKALPFHLPSQQKSERFLTALVKNCAAPVTQNQALNATVFPYANLQQRKRERDRLGRTRRRLADGIRLLYSSLFGESVPHDAKVWAEKGRNIPAPSIWFALPDSGRPRPQRVRPRFGPSAFRTWPRCRSGCGRGRPRSVRFGLRFPCLFRVQSVANNLQSGFQFFTAARPPAAPRAKKLSFASSRPLAESAA